MKKKQSRSLSLSKETLYPLDPGSLVDAKGGTLPLTVTLVPLATALAIETGILVYHAYKNVTG
ncbi:MAG: hypothetical protein JF614_25585 [Acidobacteria bacterium]|nr:hypothetical protein [Acidobacteriota bacterium]